MSEATLYPKAEYVPANPKNIGDVPLKATSVRLFVIHIAQASTQSSIDNWFKDPAAQVSAHFSVGLEGTVHQHVKLNQVAWAEAYYNGRGISIEHVGFSGDYLTRQQLNASVELLKWLHTIFPKVPLRRVSDAAGSGVIGHGELGVPGGDHPDCPGTPVLYQFNVALRA